MSAPSGTPLLPVVGCIVGAGGGAVCGEMIPNTGAEVGIYVGVGFAFTLVGFLMLTAASKKTRVRTRPNIDPNYDPLFNSDNLKENQ